MRCGLISLILWTRLLTLPAQLLAYDACPPTQECCEPCPQWHFWFDPMGVKPCQGEALEFLSFTDSQSADSTLLGATYLEPGWEFGVRVGIGLISCEQNWHFRAEYTHWANTSRGSQSFSATTGQSVVIIPALGFGVITLPQSGSATVKAVLDYCWNLLDITAGYTCCACGGFEFEPYGGFRGLWFSTKAKQTNAGGIYSAGGNTSTAKNDCCAYGIVGGLRFNYNLFRCLDFRGRLNGSLVFGENTFKTRNVNATEQASQSIASCPVLRNVEGAFGIVFRRRGGRLFDVKYGSKCCIGITSLGFDYEVAHWSDNMPIPFQDISKAGPNERLLTQSLVGRLDFCF